MTWLLLRLAGFVAGLVCGPDVADQCGGHDDSPESCYTDSVGTWRCGVCAMKVEV